MLAGGRLRVGIHAGCDDVEVCACVDREHATMVQ